jgi:hypothetical protein
MRARSSHGPLTLAASVVLGLTVAWGCGDDESMTPSCPDLPLYDARDASPSDIAAREQAASEGCVTKPGTATTAAAGAPGVGGGGGSGGSSDAAAD